MYGYIYKVTNVDTGSFYIGRHKYVEGEDFMSYLGSSYHEDFDRNKYARKSFVKEKIADANSEEELYSLERKYILENINKPGNVNDMKGIGWGGQYNFSNEEWSTISNPQEYKDFCPDCQELTIHYKNGACKKCISKIMYETHNVKSYFKKTYKNKYCPKCQKITKHSGKEYNNCSSCYNCHGLNLFKNEDGTISLRNGTNIIIKDVSFILDTQKIGNTFVFPDFNGLEITDGQETTKLLKLIRNKDISTWLKISFASKSIKPIIVTEDHPFITDYSDFVKARDLEVNQFLITSTGRRLRISSIESVDRIEDSYDVETESGFFNFSSIRSRNCRTRVIGNNYDPNNEITFGRGNLSFTSINLPRLAIESVNDKDNVDLYKSDSIDIFFDKLKDMVNLVFDQLLERFRYQCMKKAKNYPFLMGQGIWIGSDKLDPDDSVKEVLKHGSLTVGFIGLAECLKVLTGNHHGESESSQNLGIKIIKYIRDKCDAKSEETGLNFTLIATPAEGLSGTFVKLDKKKYGTIEGITDKDYYTNSFHVPVNYEISMFDKMRIESPYHALTNGGHITYVEYNGDPLDNLSAFEKIVRVAHDMKLGYFAINHVVDHCSVCSYTGIINDKCPICGNDGINPVSLSKLKELKKTHPSIIIPKE